jgi:hypothetical protein
MAKNDQDWVTLAPPVSWRRVGFIGLGGGATFVFLVNIALPITGQYVSGTWMPIVATIAGALILEAVALFVVVLLNPVPMVNMERKRIRIRRREIAFRDITSATVVVEGSVTKPELLLTFGARRGTRCGLYLRDGKDRPLPDPAREQLLTVLHESSITPPTSPYDPNGKFTKYNFPGQLGKDEVIALVESNPSAREPIPGVVPLR